jgi:hypothetical protein
MEFNYLIATVVVGVFGFICINIGVNAQYKQAQKNLHDVLVVLGEENPDALIAFNEAAQKVRSK